MRMNLQRHRFHCKVLVAMVPGFLALAACTSVPTSPACGSGQQSAVQDTLYFGTQSPVGPVSQAQWARFLAVEVTPRFPSGLTVQQASGQWRGNDGQIVHEASHVLQLIHPDDADSIASVAAIISAYKTQFRQESVLRVHSRVCASF